MKNRAGAQFAGVFVIVMSSLACGSTPTQPDQVPAPVFEQKTETYLGSLNSGGGTAFHFTVANPGNIIATITRLAPVSTLTMGLSLGFWEDTTSACSEALKNSVTLNVPIAGSPSGPDEYCVGIFDVGNLQVPTEFTLVVTHY
jgi:hypothetical protein